MKKITLQWNQRGDVMKGSVFDINEKVGCVTYITSSKNAIRIYSKGENNESISEKDDYNKFRWSQKQGN